MAALHASRGGRWREMKAAGAGIDGREVREETATTEEGWGEKRIYSNMQKEKMGSLVTVDGESELELESLPKASAAWRWRNFGGKKRGKSQRGLGVGNE